MTDDSTPPIRQGQTYRHETYWLLKIRIDNVQDDQVTFTDLEAGPYADTERTVSRESMERILREYEYDD